MRIRKDALGCRIEASHGQQLVDCDTDWVRGLLRENGYVFFDGFATSLSDFDEFSTRFGDCEEIRTVHYPPSGEALGFHAEDAYNPYRPDALWFYCRFEGSDGGAPTGVLDGVGLLGAMPGYWQSFVKDNELRFDRQWAAPVWQGAVQTAEPSAVADLLDTIPNLTYDFLPDGSLYVGYQAPFVVETAAAHLSMSNTMLQAVTEQTFYGMTLATGEPVPAQLVETVQRLALAIESDVGWRVNDVVVIDNFRMMHRRAEYSGKDRDLRARHCRNLFGSVFPETTSRTGALTKRLLQGDAGDPTSVGIPDAEVSA